MFRFPGINDAESQLRRAIAQSQMSFVTKLHSSTWQPPIAVSIGNSIISSAITDKQARVSFKKLQNSASPKDERYLRFLKTHECLFSVIAREIILLLINNIKRKCSNKHFVLKTSHYASALILEFLRLKKSCLQKTWLKVLCTKFQHTLEFVL